MVFPLADPPACAHDGLLLCLTFEDGLDDGVARDFSERRLSAKAEGVAKVTRTIAMRSEGALELLPTNDVVSEYKNAFDVDHPFSIDVWIRRTTDPSNTEQYVLDLDMQYSIYVFGDGVYCNLLLDPGNVLVTAPIPRDGWHHFACILDGDEVRAVLDGQVHGTAVASGPLFKNGRGDLRLGGESYREPPDYRIFTGEVDNVRIWNRALTASQLTAFAVGDEN